MKKFTPLYHSLNSLLPSITAPVWRKKGPQLGRLFHEWQLIVGDALAAECYPEKISANTLMVRVTPGAALQLQHQIPLLQNRINAYFGAHAIQRIQIKQGHISRPQARAKVPLPVPLDHTEAFTEQTKDVDNIDLKNQLIQLGNAMKHRLDKKKA